MKIGVIGSSLRHKNSKISFASDGVSSVSDGTRLAQDSSSFQVNKNLEYASSGAFLLAIPVVGALLGSLMGISHNKSTHEYPGRATKDFATMRKGALIGAAIGGALALISIPLTMNAARENIYKKQLEYDVMANIDKKAQHNELTPEQASDYLKARAMQNMAVTGASNAGNAGWVTAAYLAGSNSSSSKK